MTEHDEPEERRTEGVRIIGAQEAAEAAGRPDVVRRRRRSEKRYGDRPDSPEVDSDLPKIKISTSESGDLGDPDVAVPPAGAPLGTSGSEVRPAAPEPQWSEPPAAVDRTGIGHARIVEPDESAPGAPGASDAPSLGDAPMAADRPLFHDDPADDADAAVDEPYPDPGQHGDMFATPGPADDDDSFVLPHWTEPPTGQVPKVVIGSDSDSPEPLASYGSQPRWRDEGERTMVTDFDDLADESPLGALRSDPSPSGGDFFDDYDDEFPEERDDGFIDDRFMDADDAAGSDAPRRARRRPAPPARSDSPRPRRGGDDGGAPPSGDRDLTTAVAVGLGLVAVGLLCFFLGGLATTVLATVVVSLAAFEYFSAVREAGHNTATLLGAAAVAGLMLATYFVGLAAYPVVIALSIIGGLLWYLFVAPGPAAVPNLGLTLLGIAWIGVLGSFATLFLGLGKVAMDADSSLSSNPGLGVLIAAVVVAVGHDVGAYFVGRYFGHTPLSAASPNKTQEGLAGGVLSAIVVTVVVVQFIGIAPIGGDLARTFIFALICALVAPLGDLAESMVKRDLDVKDMGSILPGHGGVLDRFDALLFVLPTAYFVTVLLGVWSDLGG